MSDTEQKSLAGEYTLKTGAFVGGVQHSPGQKVVLSHEDAARFLDGGHVHPRGHYEAPAKPGPLHDPKFDPHVDADHVLPLSEFLRWMGAQYERYVQSRRDNRDRNEAFAKILAAHPEGLPMVPAPAPKPKAEDATSDPVVESKAVEADGLAKSAVDGDVVSNDGAGQSLPPIEDKPKDVTAAAPAPARPSRSPRANRNAPIA